MRSRFQIACTTIQTNGITSRKCFSLFAHAFNIPIEISHTTVILMSVVARELYWLAWIGFLMAM